MPPIIPLAPASTQNSVQSGAERLVIRSPIHCPTRTPVSSGFPLQSARGTKKSAEPVSWRPYVWPRVSTHEMVFANITIWS